MKVNLVFAAFGWHVHISITDVVYVGFVSLSLLHHTFLDVQVAHLANKTVEIVVNIDLTALIWVTFWIVSNHASRITADRLTYVCGLWIWASWKINIILVFILLHSIESGILGEMHLLHELVATKSCLVLDGAILVHHVWALDQFLASLTVNGFLVLIGLTI